MKTDPTAQAFIDNMNAYQRVLAREGTEWGHHMQELFDMLPANAISYYGVF